MNWPEGTVARPLSAADADAWVTLNDAVQAADDGGNYFSAQHVRDLLKDPRFDLDVDTIGLWSGDRMIGYGAVLSSNGDAGIDRVAADGAIHPDHRRIGLGSRLLDWTRHRATQAHAERHPQLPGVLDIGALSQVAGKRALLEGAGFELVRHFFEMEHDLTSVPPVAVPDGLRLVPFEAAYSEVTRDAHNDAFRDHWGGDSYTAEVWAVRTVGNDEFRPAMSALLLDGDRVAAFLMSCERETAGVRDCHIDLVGTRRDYRGRGAAGFLLAHALTTAREQGYDMASLGVDAESPTGALGLYERAGFTTKRVELAYSQPLGRP